MIGILGFINLECLHTHPSKKEIQTWQEKKLNVDRSDINFRFDQTLANQVIKLSEKLYNEDVKSEDPSYAQFSSSQKRELLGQLLDKVRLECFF